MELYDRRADPDESHNLADERPVLVGLLATELRRRLAKAAFSHTAAYDAMIAGWLANRNRN